MLTTNHVVWKSVEQYSHRMSFCTVLSIIAVCFAWSHFCCLWIELCSVKFTEQDGCVVLLFLEKRCASHVLVWTKRREHSFVLNVTTCQNVTTDIRNKLWDIFLQFRSFGILFKGQKVDSLYWKKHQQKLYSLWPCPHCYVITFEK